MRFIADGKMSGVETRCRIWANPAAPVAELDAQTLRVANQIASTNSLLNDQDTFANKKEVDKISMPAIIR